MDREGPKQTQSITTIQSTQNIVIVIILIKAIWISAKTQMVSRLGRSEQIIGIQVGKELL